MHDVPSEPLIDLEARSRDEQEKRLVARSDDTINVDELADTVRIKRTPRAQAPQREVDRQPWLPD